MSTMPTNRTVAIMACLNSYMNAVQMQTNMCNENKDKAKADLEVQRLKEEAEVEARNRKLEVQRLKEKVEVEARILKLEVQNYKEKADLELQTLKEKADVEVQRYREKANCEIQINDSKRKIIETEIELLKIRQQHNCATTTVEHPNKRRCIQDTVTTLLRNSRYSISAAVLAHMNQVVNEEPLSAEDVFPEVHQWFENRKDRVGICAIDVRTTPNASLLPEVFGWPAWHRCRFEGSHHEEQLRQHVTEALRPWVWVMEISNGKPKQEPVGPTAISFLRPPPSTSIRRAISCKQQEQDIQRLCEVTKVSYEEWPAKPIHDEPPSADVLQRWNAMSDKKKWTLHKLVRTMGWTDPFDSHLLVALGSKLDQWECIHVNGKNSYPKSAGRCLRRALLATRGLKGSPIVSQIRHALRCAV